LGAFAETDGGLFPPNRPPFRFLRAACTALAQFAAAALTDFPKNDLFARRRGVEGERSNAAMACARQSRRRAVCVRPAGP
jgi:hypothetical protein